MGLVKDPVSAVVAARVLSRDQGCIAPRLGATTPCRDKWGVLIPPLRSLRDQVRRRDLTLDHVPPAPGAPRISTERWLVTGCWGHMVREHWETAHRAEERKYLADRYPEQEET